MGLGVAAHLALLALQNLDAAPVWLAELSRFLPYYWLLIPLCAALVAALFLSPLWRVLALANLALFGLVTMDFHWNWAPDSSMAGTPLRVLTYNIKAPAAQSRVGGIAAIELEVARYAPDIVALQDAQQWLTGQDAPVPTPARSVFGLPYVMAYDQYVLASRFPLQDCEAGLLSGGAEPTHFMQCKARIGSRLVQLVTAHFVSPRHSLLAAKSGGLAGLQVWQDSLAFRLHQSQALLASLSQLPRPLLVMGDLNAPEASPVVANLQRAGLRDAFSEGGRGWGYSHGHALSMRLDLFRIDHILLSADLAVQSAEVGISDASEHNPVVARLLLRP